MRSAVHWLRHTAMTEPGELALEVEKLPSDVASLGRITQGLLVHCDWLSAYGLSADDFPSVSRSTLPVSERLGALKNADGLPLSQSRLPERRAIGTCRDFALTLCSFLRTIGAPARPRCGFASYFTEDWEDHWVCEHWDQNEERWRVSDPQLDDCIRADCKIEFDPWDVPRDAFIPAGVAWLRCRGHGDDPRRFGHGDTRGLWFIKVNVVRDSYALDGRETSLWDNWRKATADQRQVHPAEMTWLDALARNPEDPPGNLIPFLSE